MKHRRPRSYAGLRPFCFRALAVRWTLRRQTHHSAPPATVVPSAAPLHHQGRHRKPDEPAPVAQLLDPDAEFTTEIHLGDALRNIRIR